MKKNSVIFIIAIIVLFVAVGVINMSLNKNTKVKLETNQGEIVIELNTKVKLETNQGEIVIELYSTMPVTAGNFEKLVKEGFYDGVIFHRIIDNFMIQGGDPTGTGSGGPGYQIADEFVEGSSNLKYTISMANSGPNSGGSQFFINLQDNTFLDWDKEPFASKHPVFGKVIEGQEVVDKIANVETGFQDKPVEDVVILKASVV